MNVLNKFTYRSIKLNKKRTIVTIIGIILSTALICATAGLITSLQQTMINNAIKNYGDYHVEFESVAKNEQNYITENRNIESYMLTQDVGYSKLKESTNLYKPYVYLKEYDKMALNNLGLNLLNGRVPENSNELLISDHMRTNGEVDWKIGDKVTLKVGKRYIEGEEANQNNPCYDTNTDNGTLVLDEDKSGYIFFDETIEVEFEKEYTIVGIISRPNFADEGYDAPGYTVISYMDSIRDNSNIYVKYKNIKDTYKNTNVINGLDEMASSKDPNAKYTVEYNKSLLDYSGVTKNSSTTETLYAVAGIVIAIIIATSVFVIRNSFHISITEKYKQYGILASIGATSKQIKHNVLYEGFLIGIVAIPLGILSGIFATWVLMIVLNIILQDFMDVRFVCKVPLFAIGISSVLAIVTIYLSSLLPARKAAKASPIDAIRSSNEIKIKAKKLKMPKLIKKIFGIGGEISWKNLKRSKKKYRTTVISIFVSIVVFLSISSVIQYGFRIGGIYYEDIDYSLVVDSEISKDVIDFSEILKLNYIDRYNIPNSISGYVDFKYGSLDYSIERESGEQGIYVGIYSATDAEYKKFLKDNKLDENEYKDKAVLLDLAKGYEDDKYVEKNMLSTKEGDTIDIQLTEYNSDTRQNENIKTISIKIGKRVEKGPMGIKTYMPTFIVSENTIKKIGNYRQRSLYIDSSEPYKLQEEIEKMNADNKKWNVLNIEDDKRENDAMILVISIFLYGFISVISLIGVTNIFNTITTNMALRSKEFAMLKSIGMTDKEFNKMIRLESVFYGGKALILGVPVGLGLSYFIYNTMTDKYGINYVFPIWQILVCILFVFAIVFITMKYSQGKINKQNIIETIRNENV